MAIKRRKPHRAAISRETRRRIAVAAVLLTSLVLLMLPPRLARGIRLYAGPVFYPLQGVTEGVLMDLGQITGRASNPAPAPAEWSSLQQQNQALGEALAKTVARLEQADRQVRDLAAIRQGLEGLPCRLIPASVLPVRWMGSRSTAHLAEGSDHGVDQGNAVVLRDIDRGTQNDLEAGRPVLSALGLVGIVEAVGPRMSTVRLTTHPGTSLMVQVIVRRGETWRTGPTAVAKGTPDGSALLLTGLGRDADVAVGDYVVTSPSARSSVPPYLIIGRIARCTLRPAAVFLDVRVEPRTAPADIDRVYVLAPAAAKG